MMTCPATVPVKVELCPDASSVTANNTAAKPVPDNRREQLVRVFDFGDLIVAGCIETQRPRRQNQDRYVDHQREQQRKRLMVSMRDITPIAEPICGDRA